MNIILSLLSADFIGKIVRTGVQAVTASLVTRGVIDGDQQTVIISALVGIASVIWTAVAHVKTATPANATTGGLL